MSQDALSELKETMTKHEQLQQQQPSAPTSTAQLPSIRKLMDKWLQYNWADERKVAKWDKWSSVFVRLVDGQLEHDRRYSRPGYQLMPERLDRSFLPYGQSGSYAYDAKKIPKRTLNLVREKGCLVHVTVSFHLRVRLSLSLSVCVCVCMCVCVCAADAPRRDERGVRAEDE